MQRISNNIFSIGYQFFLKMKYIFIESLMAKFDQ